MENMFKQEFAKRIKSLRKTRHLTQEQLAEYVGVDFRYISFIENAKSFPSCTIIEKLAEALGVNYSDMFDFDENFSKQELEQKLTHLIKFFDKKKLQCLYNIAKEIL